MVCSKGKKKVFSALSVALLFSIFLSLSVVNFSVGTYKLSPVTISELSPDLKTLFNLGAPDYNFVKGYMNFTLNGQNVSYIYVVEPFNGLNPVFAGSPNSSGDLAILEVWQLTPESTSSSYSVPFSIDKLTLVSPQGLGIRIGPSYSVSCNSLVVTVNPNVGTFQLYDALGQYPGYHNFYFNFTLTVYNTFGPYKFASQSKTVHLEYNNTVVAMGGYT